MQRNYFEINGWQDVTKEAREMNGETEDDFPFCSIAGCEAVKAKCYIDCPYSTEIEGLAEAAMAAMKEQGIDVYIYALERCGSGVLFAYTFNADILDEANRLWDQGLLSEDCYDEFANELDFKRRVEEMCSLIKKQKENDDV